MLAKILVETPCSGVGQLARTRELSRKPHTMHMSPHGTDRPPTPRRITRSRRYVGRHRRARSWLVGTCIQVLLTGVLIFGAAGQIYGSAERHVTAVHRDV